MCIDMSHALYASKRRVSQRVRSLVESANESAIVERESERPFSLRLSFALAVFVLFFALSGGDA